MYWRNVKQYHYNSAPSWRSFIERQRYSPATDVRWAASQLRGSLLLRSTNTFSLSSYLPSPHKQYGCRPVQCAVAYELTFTLFSFPQSCQPCFSSGTCGPSAGCRWASLGRPSVAFITQKREFTATDPNYPTSCRATTSHSLYWIKVSRFSGNSCVID